MLMGVGQMDVGLMELLLTVVLLILGTEVIYFIWLR
jgi:hypothetical protein